MRLVTFIVMALLAASSAVAFEETEYDCVSTSGTPFTGKLTIYYTPDENSDAASGRLSLLGHNIINGNRSAKMLYADVIGSLTYRILAQGPAVGYTTSWSYNTYTFSLDQLQLTIRPILITDDLVTEVHGAKETYSCVKAVKQP